LGQEPVTSEPGWFVSDDHRLFGWLHRPAAPTVRGAVVLCQPVFSEYFLTYGTFRRLADRFAGAGVAALRFDYRATGDSTGTPADITDVDGWSRDIAAAVGLLRDGGAPWVAVVAMRVAALLVPPSARADAVVLWDPVPSGRAFVRSWRLLDRVATDAAGSDPFAKTARAPDEPVGSDGPADRPVGFAYPPSFVQSVRARRLPDGGGTAPTLVLTRSGELPRGVAGPRVDVGVAAGQDALLETFPDMVRSPETTMDALREWLDGHVPSVPPAPLRVDLAPQVDLGGVVERPRRIGGLAGRGLFAIETGPDVTPGDGAPFTCLLMTSGVQTHIGPQRLYVDLARRLAREGVRVVRADFSGIGDSPDREPYASNVVYSPGILDDIDDVVGSVDGGRLVIFGLCSGGYHALEAALRHCVHGVIAVHAELENGNLEHRPETYTPERQAWVGYRGWIRWLNRSAVGRAVVWRVPGPVWWLLDRVGLQPDPGRAVQRIVERGSDVVLVVEGWYAERPRTWPTLHRRRARPTIVASRAEHSLLRLVDRESVEELVVEVMRNWLAGRPAGSGAVATHKVP
jgi:alpha-beta hydrolase superfamily lysophospholipase